MPAWLIVILAVAIAVFLALVGPALRNVAQHRWGLWLPHEDDDPPPYKWVPPPVERKPDNPWVAAELDGLGKSDLVDRGDR